jgi:hypothetical protein
MPFCTWQSQDIYTVDSGSSLKEIYLRSYTYEAIHEYNEDTMYIRKFFKAERAVATPASCAASALRGSHVCTASSSVTCVTNLNYFKKNAFLQLCSVWASSVISLALPTEPFGEEVRDRSV